MSKQTCDQLQEQALRLLDGNHLEAAKDLYAQAHALEPDNSEVLLMIGAIDSELGHMAAAIVSVRAAIQLRPDYSEALVMLSRLLLSETQDDEAIRCLERATRADHDYSEAWALLGAVLSQVGRDTEAEPALRKGLELDPEDANAWTVLAGIFYRSERFDDAIDAYNRMAALLPESMEARRMLMQIYAQQQDAQNVIRCCDQLLDLDRDQFDCYVMRGDALTSLCRQDEALMSYQVAVEIEDSHFDLWNKMGVLFAESQQYSDAAASFLKALSCDGGDIPPTYCAIGGAYLASYQIRDAEKYSRMAVEKAPDWPIGHITLAQALNAKGDAEGASAEYEEVLKLDSEHVDGLIGRALTHQRLGRISEALDTLQPLVDRYPDLAKVIIARAALCGRKGPLQETVNSLKRLEAGPPLEYHEELQSTFTAGKLYDWLGQWDEAFEAYRRGNSMKGASFDIDGHNQFIDSVIKVTGGDAGQQLVSSTNKTERPIFIIGMPRSGTSLTETILASHPEVAAAGELREISRYAQILQGEDPGSRLFPGEMPNTTVDYLNTLADTYLGLLSGISGSALRVTDKMPTNFLWLGLIARLFPRAKIVHVRRTAMDTCLSCYFQDFAGDLQFSYDLKSLGGYYQTYERLMQHWREALPNMSMLEVDYESLVTKPETEIPKLIEFCGLEWDDRCLRPHKSGVVVNTASFEQVQRPIYQDSVGRWKYYDKYLDVLKAMVSN